MDALGDRRRNSERDVPTLVQLLWADDFQHAYFLLEEGADGISLQTPEISQLFGLEVTLERAAART